MSEQFPTVHDLRQTPGVLRHLSRLARFFPDDPRRTRRTSATQHGDSVRFRRHYMCDQSRSPERPAHLVIIGKQYINFRHSQFAPCWNMKQNVLLKH